MDTSNQQTQNLNIDTSFEQALDAVPEEVRQFIWSDAFNIIIQAIGETYHLIPEQKEVVHKVAIDTLIGATTPVSRDIELSDAGIIDTVKDDILIAINEELVTRALYQAELYQGLNEEGDPALDDVSKTTNTSTKQDIPQNTLATISTRLTQSSVIAPPTKRDYSLERAPTSPSTDTPKVADSYREAVE